MAAGQDSITGADSHGRTQQQQAVILEEACKRVRFGLSNSSNVGVEGQVPALPSDSVDESASITLGEEDTFEGPLGVRQNVSAAQNSLDSIVPDTEVSNDGSTHHKQGKGPQRASFASLFAENRQINNGSKLEQTEYVEEDVIVEADETDLDWSPWQYSLVGYFGGRFPGKIALKQIVDSWKVHVAIHFHNSGWIIFKFENEEAKIQVLQGGPYMIFGRPLLLKLMPQFFKFENEELSTFPVWVQLRNLPLALWGTSVLSKICSRLGKPIATDKMTAFRERVSFARALVEVDVAKPVKHSINIVLPNGDRMEQLVVYENLPSFCSHCKKVGHSLEGCKAQERASAKIKQAVTARATTAKNASADKAVPTTKQSIAGPSRPAQATKENAPTVADLNTVQEHQAQDGKMLSIGQRQGRDKNIIEEQVLPAVAEEDAQAICRVSAQNRMVEAAAVGMIQPSADQMIERGKSSMELVQVGDSANPVVNSPSAAGKKKNKKKDRRKELA